MPGLSPTLLGMPHFILENIVEKTDVFARCSLQKCSKHLHNFVPKSPFHFKEIKIYFAQKMMSLEMTANSETTTVKYCDPSSQETGGNLVKDADYIQRLVSDLVAIVGGDKVTVKRLKMDQAEIQLDPLDDDDVFDDLGGTYPEIEFVSDKDYFLHYLQEKLNQKTLKVRKLEYFITYGKTEEDLLKILQVLEPGVLYSLYITAMQEHSFYVLQTLPRVTETEQWKRAGKLVISECQIPFEKLTHFKKIKSTECKWTVADVDCLMQSAIAQGDDFGYYKFTDYGNNRNNDFEEYIRNLPHYRGKTPEVGKLSIYSFVLTLDIRIVTEKYLERMRRFAEGMAQHNYEFAF